MAATEKKLGALHEAVTDALIELVKGIEIDDFDDNGEPTGEKRRLPPSAAVIQAASKFLKDNEITCVADEDNKLGELKQGVEARAARREQRRKEMEDAAREAGFLGGLN
jgi:hypothetical protein